MSEIPKNREGEQLGRLDEGERAFLKNYYDPITRKQQSVEVLQGLMESEGSSWEVKAIQEVNRLLLYYSFDRQSFGYDGYILDMDSDIPVWKNISKDGRWNPPLIEAGGEQESPDMRDVRKRIENTNAFKRRNIRLVE